MVQAEVADRLAAAPGSKVYGVPSVKANWYAEVKRAGSIGRNVFWPAPNVDCGLVSLVRRDRADHDDRAPGRGVRRRRRRVRAAPQDAARRPRRLGRLRRRRRGGARRRRRLAAGPRGGPDGRGVRPDRGEARRRRRTPRTPRRTPAGVRTAERRATPAPRRGVGSAVRSGDRTRPRQGQRPARGGRPPAPTASTTWPTSSSRSASTTRSPSPRPTSCASPARARTPARCRWTTRTWRPAPPLALAERLRPRPAVHLHIAKDIPVAGGMAGGSADGAGALLACDALWGTGASREELLDICAELGSDVPFSLVGGAALGTGRGERLRVAGGRRDLPLGVRDGRARTVDAGRLPGVRPAGTRGGAGPRAGRLAGPARRAGRGRRRRARAAVSNDLQPAALSLLPGARRHPRRGPSAGALAALVSGSGPTTRVPRRGRGVRGGRRRGARRVRHLPHRSASPAPRPRARTSCADPPATVPGRPRGPTRTPRARGCRARPERCPGTGRARRRGPGHAWAAAPGARTTLEGRSSPLSGEKWPSTWSMSRPSARCTAPVPCSTASPSASPRGTASAWSAGTATARRP